MADDKIFDALFNSREEFVMFFYEKENDTQENREAILKTDKLRFWFCNDISDREELWRGITDPNFAYLYCKYVRDRPEVRARITGKWEADYNVWTGVKRSRRRKGGYNDV